MTDATAMFAPFNAQEKIELKNCAFERDEGMAIVPVPVDAPPEIPSHTRLGTPAMIWEYRDAQGQLLQKVCRFMLADGKKQYCPLTYRAFQDGSRRWTWKGLDTPRPLYGCDRLAARPDAPVIICEGEKAADAAAAIFRGHVAVTSPNGAGSSDKVDWRPLTGRHVTIWPDCDDSGHKYAQRVARLAKDAGAISVSIVAVPEDFKEKKTGWDLADDLPEGRTLDDLSRLLNKAPPVFFDTDVVTVPDDDETADLEKIRAAAERMARLDDAVIDKRLGAETKTLGIGKRVLRKEIQKARLRLEAERMAQEEPQENPKDPRGRVDLEVVSSDLPDTAEELAKRLATQPMLFDRGGPARLSFDVQKNSMTIDLLTATGVVNECHQIARPWQYRKTQDGSFIRQNVTLPERVARLYLDRKGHWGLRPLDGISFAPLLSEDGSIRTVCGYDDITKLWCEKIPDIYVPENPTQKEAEDALLFLRQTFRTFAFADAVKVNDAALGVQVIDLDQPPGEDESAALAAILTGVCRPSLWLAPAIVARTPAFSGAGTGKGLLMRGISALGFGKDPKAMTTGATPEEFDKRISSALIDASETLFLDNVNGQTLKSDVLASALTERPCQVRPLGRSVMVPLNVSTLVLITGNGLVLSEDMARRCLVIELDACMENPEERPFKGGFVADVLARRGDLLRAALTIWRWGRQNEKDLKTGRPLGSYEQWCRWVRDPLLTLGCRDPVDKVATTKANDPRRRVIAEMFNAWWAAHKNNFVTVAGLHATVKAIIDPHNRGRQYLAAQVRKLEGTRAAGFVLARTAPDGKWTADRYQLFQTQERNSPKTIGDHRGASAGLYAPMTPMTPDDFEEQAIGDTNNCAVSVQTDDTGLEIVTEKIESIQ